MWLWVLIAGLLTACNHPAAPAGTLAKADAAVQKPVNGERIFKQYCVTCHGASGDMGVGGAANLAASALSAEERVLVITKGRNTMASFSALLREEEIRAVAEYTLQLSNNTEE